MGLLGNLFKEDYIGHAGNDNIQDFPTQGISNYTDTDFIEIGSINKEDRRFTARTIVFFDSIVRLDFALMFRSSVVGFVTITTGSVGSEYSKPIEMSKSVDYEIFRYIIAPRKVLKDQILNGSTLEVSRGIKYSIYPIESEISRVSELWNEYVLKIFLQNTEVEFISKKIKKYDNNDTIFVKDGNLQGLNTSNVNLIGHVKTFDIPNFLLSDSIITGKSQTSKVYKRDNTYSCYINYGYNRKTSLGKSGTFNFSRVDIVSETSNYEEIVSRFNFITRYLLNITSLFSDSSRFPQNLPIIESLEKFLRNVSGDINIVRHRIMKSLYLT